MELLGGIALCVHILGGECTSFFSGGSYNEDGGIICAQTGEKAGLNKIDVFVSVELL